MGSEVNIAVFESLFKEHYRFLSVVAFGVVKDGEAANDIVQNFYLDLWQRRKDITITHSFQSYATRAVKNLSISWLRKQKQFDLVDIQDYEEDIPAEAAADPEDFIRKEDIDSRVLKAVDLLPAARRQIFLAYVAEGLSYADIAQKYGISINTVKTQMKRAYTFLKAQVSDDKLGVILVAVILANTTK